MCVSLLSRHLFHRLARRNWWLCIPFSYALMSLAALGLRFPSLWASNRAPTLALASWPTQALREFVAFSLGVVFTACAWGAALVALLWRAATRLQRAPYLPTRRHQLGHRFFVLQALLIAGVVSAASAYPFFSLVSLVFFFKSHLRETRQALAAYVNLFIELAHKYRSSLATVARAGLHGHGSTSASHGISIEDSNALVRESG